MRQRKEITRREFLPRMGAIAFIMAEAVSSPASLLARPEGDKTSETNHATEKSKYYQAFFACVDEAGRKYRRHAQHPEEGKCRALLAINLETSFINQQGERVVSGTSPCYLQLSPRDELTVTQQWEAFNHFFAVLARTAEIGLSDDRLELSGYVRETTNYADGSRYVRRFNLDTLPAQPLIAKAEYQPAPVLNQVVETDVPAPQKSGE
jgi:hypothetical protein